MRGLGPVQPGFTSRIVAFVLAGLLAFELQADLAAWLANPTGDITDGPAMAAAARPDASGEAVTAGHDDSGAIAAEPSPPAREPEPAAQPEPAPAAAVAQTRRGEPELIATIVPADETAAAQVDVTASKPSLADRIAEVLAMDGAGSPDESSMIAAELLDTSGGAEALLAGLLAEAVPRSAAELQVLRTLILGEQVPEARRLARGLKRENPGDAETDAAIRELSLLRPRIVDLDSFIDPRNRLVITGAVRNEDVAAVRRVKVMAEALDGEGNVIASGTTRVKPRLIAATVDGSFTVRFGRGIDPERVGRTRVTVVRYEYEVLE